MTKLNAMQGKCFDKAFNSNNNLLMCAPTGAGKTNVAIMTALREMAPTSRVESLQLSPVLASCVL